MNTEILIDVIVDVRIFNELMNLHTRQHRPTLAELLDELSEIHKFEKVEIEAPPRQDRPDETIEMADEISI